MHHVASFYTQALNELQVQKVIHRIKANANLFSSLKFVCIRNVTIELEIGSLNLP